MLDLEDCGNGQNKHRLEKKVKEEDGQEKVVRGKEAGFKFRTGIKLAKCSNRLK